MKSFMVKVALSIILIFLFSYASAQQNQTESRDAEFYFNRGVASANKGQYDQAISDFTEVLKINPRIAPAYANRGLVSYSKGLYDQAISDFTKALEINPRDAMTYYNRGLAYAVKGQVDQVISDCTNALEIDPRIASAYNNRGVAYKSKGQYDQAISDCTKALEINPRDATAYNYRGIAYEKKGQYDQAISDLTEALKINPRLAEAYKNRQIAYEKKGQHDRTISDDTKAHLGEYRIRTTHYIVVAVAFIIIFLLLKKLFTSPFSERNRPLKCKTCGSPLVDGPYVERHGGNNHFKCTVKGIPTKVCPRGCPGTYSCQPDFSDEVLDAIYEDSQNIAKGRLGWAKERQFCRRCNVELTYKGQRAQFVFHQKIKKGTETEVTIEAPCLECTLCGSKYLPSEPGDDDSYHDELNNVIAGVVNQELIILRPTNINRFVTLPLRIILLMVFFTFLVILLTVFLTFLGLPISRWVANHKADEIMRPAFDEGWVRRTTWLALAGVERSFQPRWVVQYENTGTRVFVDFGPQFRINLVGAIIHMSPEDLVERIRRNKLRVEQAGPPDAPYDSKGQDDQAISDYTKALEINPGNAEAYFKRAFWYGVKGQHDEAISDYTKALEINPRVAATYNNRGVSYDSKGQHDQAILDYTKALEINPSYADAYNNRAFSYFKKGEYEKSWEDIEKAESLGHQISPKFLDDLRKASGRKE